MLRDMRQDCITYASLLGNYQEMSVETLLDGYCSGLDNNNEDDKNCYLAALVLRFWYTIEKLYQQSTGFGVDREEMFMWLVEAINYACKYRAWTKADKKVNGRQAINMCIETIKLQHFYELNLDKHRANWNSSSLDISFSSNDGSEEKTVADTVRSVGADHDRSGTQAEILIQSIIDENQVIDAIILDTIAFNDVQKHTKKVERGIDENGQEYKYTSYYTEFWPYKLVQILGSLPEDYIKYFSSKYNIAANKLEVSLAAIKQATNQKLYKYVDSARNLLKTRFED